MITPYQLLQESGFAQYTAMVRFHYNRNNTSLGAEKIAEMVRAIPGATRVSTVSLDKEHGIGIFNVKIISMKPPKEAYQALKQNALDRYQGLITGVEVGANTIETKGDFIIKENLRDLDKSNLGQYIGQLLEEGLLLEVSIDELRRQWVDSGKIDEETFNQVVQASNNQSNYATWLVKKVASKIINTEDLQMWSEIFTFFDRYKQRFQKKDINQVKTREDVTAFITDYNSVKDAVEAQKQSGMNKADKERTDPCFLGKLKTSDGRKWTVYKTKPGQWTEERKIGSGTSWCTVASQDYFKSYLRNDPNPAYYIFINQKDPSEKYQIHYHSDQFKDKDDHEVDREEDWALEFFEYLKEVDGRTEVTPRTKIAIKAKEARKGILRTLEQETRSVAPSFKVFEKDGNTVYYIPTYSNTLDKGRDVDLAKLFVELNYDTPERSVREALNLSSIDICLIRLASGKFDIVRKGSESDYISSITFRGANVSNYDSKLPLATDENIDAYKGAANELSSTINPVVLVRTDKRLPDLSKFLVKSEGQHKIYRLDSRKKETWKAFLQAGFPDIRYLASDPQDLLVYEGPSKPRCCTHPYARLDAKTGQPENFFGTQTVEFLEDCSRFYETLKQLGFDYTSNPSPDSKFATMIAAWTKLGGKNGIKKQIEADTTENPEGIPSEYKVGTSQTLATIIGYFSYQRYINTTRRPVRFITKDFNTFCVVSENASEIYLFQLDTGSVVGRIRRLEFQKDIRETGIAPEVLARFCQFAQIDQLPSSLEKILSRLRGTANEVPNVLKLLRYNQTHQNLQVVHLPIYRNRRNGVPYGVGSGGAIYGSWEQLGPAIRESSSGYWSQINAAIQDHPGATTDVAVWFNSDNPRHTWNCVVRIIENNVVVWYARRWGNGIGVSWNMREVPEDIRVTLNGEAPNNNYRAPEPPAPRRTRQARAAAAHEPGQQAAPAPELTPEQQQQIQQSRVQVQNAPEAYRFDAQHAQQGLAALGFTNISQELAAQPNNMVQAVVYRTHDHRGNTTHVALLYANNANTVVAGYPQNPTLATAEGCSTAWRRLTQQLDNSVRTFQQCHDICQELHIPIPPAIQGWLVYRGQ